MVLTREQYACIDTPNNTISLVEGYSGVGKSVVLIEKYLQYKNQNEEAFIVVKDVFKKFYLNLLAISNFQRDIHDDIVAIDDLINRYIESLNHALFTNRISDAEKLSIIESLFNQREAKVLDVSFETVLNEITFIQENICTNESGVLGDILRREFIHYYKMSRKHSVKGLLDHYQKTFIWDVYQKYIKYLLEHDLFDQQSLYQSVLRLLFKQISSGEKPYLCQYLFIDDIQDFTLVQLETIDKLFDRTGDYYLMMTHDPLQSLDRYRNYQKSTLYKDVVYRFHLYENFKNSPNIHRIIHANLKNNPLFEVKHTYDSANPEGDFLGTVLTYFYHQKQDEKIDVVFDRLDLLMNQMDYRYEDILFVFYDYSSYESLAKVFEEEGIPFISVKERFIDKKSGIVNMLKDEIVKIPFRVVFLYDADNKKIGHGHISHVINVQHNYRDSVLFYQSIANATELLIIHTSVSEPSPFLFPAMVEEQDFTFEIGSKFTIKPQLNVLRLGDFVAWIRNELIEHYGYDPDDFYTDHTFELIVLNGHEKIAIKIHDPNIEPEEIGEIIQKGLNYDYIVLFDNYHYIVYQNIQKNFIRRIDFPNKNKPKVVKIDETTRIM